MLGFDYLRRLHNLKGLRTHHLLLLLLRKQMRHLAGLKHLTVLESHGRRNVVDSLTSPFDRVAGVERQSLLILTHCDFLSESMLMLGLGRRLFWTLLGMEKVVVHLIIIF